MKIGRRKVTTALALVGIAALGVLGNWLGGTDGLLAVTLLVVATTGAGLGWHIARSERVIRQMLVDLRRAQSASVRDQLQPYTRRIERLVAAHGRPGEQAEQLLEAIRGGYLRLDAEWQLARETILARLEEELGSMRRDMAIATRHVEVAGRELDIAVKSFSRGVGPDNSDVYSDQLASHQAAIVEQHNVLFRQIEALAALYLDIQPRIGLPPTRFWAASPDLLRTLHELVRERSPRLVVECGSGVSTLVMAFAMKTLGVGKIVSLEHDETYKALTEELLKQHDVGDVVDVRLAPLRDTEVGQATWTWYSTGNLPTEQIDLLVVDGPPSSVGKLSRYPAIPLLGDQVAPGGIVVLDDYARSDEAEIVKRWLEEQPGWALRVLRHEKGTALLEKVPVEAAKEARDSMIVGPESRPSHVTERHQS
jgi:predicted O-methyltransferase YrrM